MNTRVRGKGRGFYRGYRNPVPSSNTAAPSKTEVITAISHNDNNCCSRANINLDLDPNTFAFLNDLKTMWNLCKIIIFMPLNLNFSFQ